MVTGPVVSLDDLGTGIAGLTSWYGGQGLGLAAPT